MAQESEQPDPYVTPRTLPVRRPLKYLMFILIAGIVLIAVSASAFIIDNARKKGRLQRNSNALKNYMPYLERSYEVKVPPSYDPSSEPDKSSPWTIEHAGDQ